MHAHNASAPTHLLDVSRQVARTRRILIVDDNHELSSLMVIQLNAAGFDVITATSAADAIAEATAVHPDLAILDILMEGSSGLELARLLRDQFKVPFMFLSVLEDADTVNSATEIGALAYLVKPQDLRQLVPLVTAALARAEELEKLRTTESQLEKALQRSRTVSIAVGMLMERYHVGRTVAFSMLRDHARSSRRSITETADELLSAAEILNQYPAPSPVNPKSKPATR